MAQSATSKSDRQGLDIENQQPPRRRFLTFLWVFLGLAVLSELIWVAGSFLLSRGRKTAGTGEFGSLMEAGAVDAFLPETVTAFPRGHYYLARLADGGFLAISRQCTHLGCTVPWVAEQQQFVCPCHSSVFDIRGEIVRSPASRPLDLFQVIIENNLVTVDTGNRLRRSSFRKEQVTYPEA